MKIWAIIEEEVKRNFRRINVLIIMTMLPIFLILILGVVFDGILGNGAPSIGDMKVYHMTIGEASYLTDNVNLMMDGVLSDDESNEYIQTNDREGTIELLKNAEITCFVVVDETIPEIHIYKNSLYNTESSLLEGVLGTFVSRYNAISEIVKVNPAAMSVINDEVGNYTKARSLDAEKIPNAMDYYGVVEVTLFVLYGVMTPFYGVFSDRRTGVSDRILSTSIKKRNYFLGKFFASILITVLQMGIVIFFSSEIMGASWGDKPLLPFLLVFTEILAITSVGLSFGMTAKNENAAQTVIHLVISIFGFFGGAYVSLYDMGFLGEIGKYFSILWWNNSGIMNYIYLDETKFLGLAFMVNIAIALVFFGIAVLKMRRMENFKNE
jgi:ABC-2 type transport system permease protein